MFALPLKFNEQSFMLGLRSLLVHVVQGVLVQVISYYRISLLLSY